MGRSRLAQVALLVSLAGLAGLALAVPQAKVDRTGRVTLEVGTDSRAMIFDRTELTVPAGATVTVVFRNNLRSTPMPHNWVLVRPGNEQDVAEAGRKAGLKSDFLQRGDARVIAATPLTAPGGQRSVTFVAPAPGSYPYICTFPGHYLVMRGTLRVTPVSPPHVAASR